jgi:hypothetical protein
MHGSGHHWKCCPQHALTNSTWWYSNTNYRRKQDQDRPIWKRGQPERENMYRTIPTQKRILQWNIHLRQQYPFPYQIYLSVIQQCTMQYSSILMYLVNSFKSHWEAECSSSYLHNFRNPILLNKGSYGMCMVSVRSNVCPEWPFPCTDNNTGILYISSSLDIHIEHIIVSIQN